MPSLSQFLVVALLMLIQPAFCATIILNSYDILVSGNGTDTDASPSDPAQASVNLASNLGSADATAASLTASNLNGNPESHVFTAQNFASASVNRQSGAGNQSPQGSATASYSIGFNLSALEVVNASFDLSYFLDSNVTTLPSVSWLLTGPDPNVTSISGSSTTTGSSSTQTATLSTAGTYTLTITATVPDQGFGSNRYATADLTNLSFTLDSSIPEPSTPIMTIIALIGLTCRRSRSAF